METSRDRELKRFAELLIHLVRDRAVDHCDRLLVGGFKGACGERWSNYGQDVRTRDAVRMC
jgi:hypothetical protein